MLKRNQKWYLNHKEPGSRVGKFFLQQLDRENRLLLDLHTLFRGYDNEKQAGLKLGAANSIGRCIGRITDLLGVKGRSIDDLALEEKLQTMKTNLDKYMRDAEEYRQKQKVHPI